MSATNAAGVTGWPGARKAPAAGRGRRNRPATVSATNAKVTKMK